ncbi:substrate-specific activator of APC-dependent proteolysis [Dinochytrium kinnereticum]|nr:substrate-specific activator of APC-dependent proteolysis [Dinochytrium kinnereticum]
MQASGRRRSKRVAESKGRAKTIAEDVPWLETAEEQVEPTSCSLSLEVTPKKKRTWEDDHAPSSPTLLRPFKKTHEHFKFDDRMYQAVVRAEIVGLPSENYDARPYIISPTRSSPREPVLQFHTPRKKTHFDSPHHDRFSLTPLSKSSQDMLTTPTKYKREIAKVPYKVLDAPELQDDFYLNLVDWSQKNMLGVGLGACVYLWNASNCKVQKLCDLSQFDHITSVNFNPKGTHVAIGTNRGQVQIWDVAQSRRLRELSGHESRVGSLAWNGDYVLTSGSRDKQILHRDLRAPQTVQTLSSHRQEANMLASGGGTADRRIRFWNASSGSVLSSFDTNSQVCNLAWCKNSNEIVSTHGYSQNQVCVWKFNNPMDRKLPQISPIATLTGHTFRVLYLATSPDGQSIVTGAGDETLRFWNVFPKAKVKDENVFGTDTKMEIIR